MGIRSWVEPATQSLFWQCYKTKREQTLAQFPSWHIAFVLLWLLIGHYAVWPKFTHQSPLFNLFLAGCGICSFLFGHSRYTLCSALNSYHRNHISIKIIWHRSDMGKCYRNMILKCLLLLNFSSRNNPAFWDTNAQKIPYTK